MEFQIDADVPIPPLGERLPGKKLKVGESIFIPVGHFYGRNPHAYLGTARLRPKRFVQRTMRNDKGSKIGVRLWRVE